MKERPVQGKQSGPSSSEAQDEREADGNREL